MPDRRQTDRRSGQKKLSISLTTFSMICVVFAVIIVAILLCSYFDTTGYNNGYQDGYQDAYAENYNDSFNKGYSQGYIDGQDSSNTGYSINEFPIDE